MPCKPLDDTCKPKPMWLCNDTALAVEIADAIIAAEPVYTYTGTYLYVGTPTTTTIPANVTSVAIDVLAIGAGGGPTLDTGGGAQLLGACQTLRFEAPAGGVLTFADFDVVTDVDDAVGISYVVRS